MSVDSTDLLNRRHLREDIKDEFFISEYPAAGDEMSFDDVVVYKPSPSRSSLLSNAAATADKPPRKLAVVTYGNGVAAALVTMERLCSSGIDVTVIDCPYLSAPPQQLKDLLCKGDSQKPFDCVLFADVCKQGAGMPFGGIAITLQNEGYLNIKWKVIGASPTYNPLGRILTFLSSDDIYRAALDLVR